MLTRILAWFRPAAQPAAERARSPRWHAVRRAFLAGKVCAACGRA